MIDGSAWEEECRELMLCCDAQGIITWADARAERKLNARVGGSFMSLLAPGGEEKGRVLLERARSEKVRDSELAVLASAKVATYSFCAKPDGTGGTLLLGTSLPEDYVGALQQVQHSMNEIVELNRQMLRQKRELERQKQELERAYRELDESNRGVVSLHAELEDKAASLKRAADVKGRVVANVSHEFRTPLHTILGLSKILLDAADGPLTDEQQKQVRYIRSSAEELQHMVNDLLDLSKAESGKAQLRPETFTLEQLFATLRGQMRPLLAPNQAIELAFDPPPDATLETDLGKVAQIMRNLISNALKFTERGQVLVSAEIVGERAVLRVKDTGIGVAPEHFERIFEEFGQIDSPIQRRVKGTGLGLPLSKRLAELLDGKLSVESSLGRGATFSLEIPCSHPEVRELAAIAARPLDPSKAHVMVVEDDRKTIFVYEKYLSMAGFQVVPSRSIGEARHRLQHDRPAAIVLDVMLEGETSWDFLAELKRNRETNDIPVLVVTVTSKAEKARALGADEFWLKPIDQDRLIKKLRSLTAHGDRPARLLMIDDDERSRYLVRKLLTNTPYTISEAESGPEGVQLARELRPDIIFLDFLLQDITAFDVLDELKADPLTRGIPVIVITSHALDANERSRLAAGTEAIVSKENLSRELAIQRIRDALQKAGVATNYGK